MGKKRCEEEFNPWPPFVDIFSSVILVLLLFLLITIVNIAYYAQFKFKVSYTGTVATNEVIPSQTAVPQPTRVDAIEEPEEIKDDVGDIESAGKDLSRIYEDEETKQAILNEGDYIILNFGSNGIKLDNPIILQIKEFIAQAKQRYANHNVKISAIDPTNQISATVMKQISLARTLNARNLIRQLDYDIKEVQVDLLNPDSISIENENEFGYLIIRVEPK
jgi:hypothetical protein